MYIMLKIKCNDGKPNSSAVTAEPRMDLRSHPPSSAPQKLERRTSFTLPAGTTFGFDADVLREMLEEGRVRERDLSQKVGSLVLGGTTHEFSFFEPTLIGRTCSKDWRAELGADRVHARLELVVRMYARRFPFEAPE